MKQMIPFVKDISLDSKISEITSIALEHNLRMENNDSVVGTFTISGKYKMNDISINEEVFEKKINFDITLDDKYDASKVTIDVDNFYYEIINDEYLRVHIYVMVDNLVYYKDEKQILQEIEKPELIEINDLKEERKKDEEENMKNSITSDELNVNENEKRNDSSLNNADIAKNLTSGFLSDEERFSTYKVHIIRESETIETVMEKYNVSKEEIEKYNNLDNVILGTKIIVPLKNE